jgi:hypothetical protein
MAAFTTVAAAVGMTAALGGSVKSFSDASKQQRLQRQAEQDAKTALDKAIAQIKVNPYDALGIFKEPYELQREANLSQGAQGIEAAKEADRGAAETAGRTYMAQNEAQAGIRTEMGKDLQNIAELKTGEDVNIKNDLASIDLNNAAGYQKQAKEAKENAAKMQAQGFQGIVSAAQQGAQAFYPLYARQHGIDPNTGLKIDQSLKNAQNNMNAIGQPTVIPPSQKLVQGALSPMNMAATTPANNFAMQQQSAYSNPWTSPFAQQMNPFLFYQQ